MTDRAPLPFRRRVQMMALLAVVAALGACVDVPMAARRESARQYGSSGFIHITLTERAGPFAVAGSASYLGGSKPYVPGALRERHCGSARIPVTVVWSDADGIVESQLVDACESVRQAIEFDERFTGLDGPVVEYRVQLIPRGFTIDRTASSWHPLGRLHVLYLFHVQDRQTLIANIVDTLAHENLHLQAELRHVPRARRIDEEHVAYLGGACAQLEVTGQLNPKDLLRIDFSKTAVPSSMRRSSAGGMLTNDAIRGYFPDAKVLDRDSPKGREFSQLCNSTLQAFFAPGS